MALDYVSDIKPLEDAGKTDAEIATLFSAQTQTDMPNLQLRKYFHRNDLWLVDPATGLRLAGTIGEAYSGLTAPQQSQIRKLQNWVYDQESIETENDLDIAVEFKTIIDGMVTLAILTSQQRVQIGAIAGGLKHGAVTAGEVGQVRTDWQAAEAQRIADEAAAAAAAQAAAEHEAWRQDYIGRHNAQIAAILDDTPNRDNAALVAALQALATDLQNNPWSP